METRHIDIKVEVASRLDELEKTDRELVMRAQEAAGRAYAPYSQFNVGACLLLDNGEMIEGNNQENASYPCGCCAERTALNYARSKYPGMAVKAIAIAAFNSDGQLNTPIPPCGICRQALLECEADSGRPIKVIMNGKSLTNIVHSVADLLPLSFDKTNLNE